VSGLEQSAPGLRCRGGITFQASPTNAVQSIGRQLRMLIHVPSGFPSPFGNWETEAAAAQLVSPTLVAGAGG
jgi:hypothetical protein